MKSVKATLNGNVLELRNITRGNRPEFEEYSPYALVTPIYTEELFYNGVKVADVTNDGFGYDPDIKYIKGANKAGIRMFVKDASSIVREARETQSGDYIEDRYDSLGYIISLMSISKTKEFNF